MEALLPTEDTRVDLLDEGDLLGSEIFSSNAAGLSPSLLAWYGEPVQDGIAGSIFLMGRGFSVSETQVIVGGVPLLQGTGFRLISRNVMQIIVPPNSRSVKMALEQDDDSDPTPSAPPVAVTTLRADGVPAVDARGGVAEVQINGDIAHAELDPNLNPDVNLTIGDRANARGAKVDLRVGGIHAHAEGTTKVPMKPSELAFMDVHIATPNGISNHLYVEVVPKDKPTHGRMWLPRRPPRRRWKATRRPPRRSSRLHLPGVVLPPLTVLPMGTTWPPASVLAPGQINGAPTGSLLQGLVPTPATTPASPISAGSPLSLTPPATPPPTLPPLPTTTPPAVPPTNITPPPAPPQASAAPTSSSGRPTIVASRTHAEVVVQPSGRRRPTLHYLLCRANPRGRLARRVHLQRTALSVRPMPINLLVRRIRPPILRRIGVPDR